MSDASGSAWDHTYDVVVLGSGAAGLAGALQAALSGQSVVIIEKSPVWGGSAAMSAGALWVPANKKMSSVGIDDSEDDALRYLKAVTAGAVAEDRLLAFVRGANRMVESFERDSHLRLEPVREYPDYNTDLDGAKPGGRVLEPVPYSGVELGDEFATLHPCYPGELVFDRFMMTIPEARSLLLPGAAPKLGLLAGFGRYLRRRGARRRLGRDPYLTMGQALTSRLRRSLIDRDVPLWLATPAQGLVTEDGRVVGVDVARGGRTERIRATAGLLLATGGFEHNDELRQKYQRHPVESAWSAGHIDNTGDGIGLGEQVGATLDTDLMQEAWWAPSVVPPGEPTAWVLVIEKSLPYGFFVDRGGKRFTNEAANYTDVGAAMYAADADTGQAVPAWLVFDSRFRKKFPLGPIKPGMMMPDRKLPERLQPGNGWLHRADTVDELARSIGVPADALLASVERFNDLARTGDDVDFGRGKTLNDLHYTDPRVQPNPSLGSIEKGPFYAVPVVPGDLGTKAGLVTDADGRVLDGDDRPVAGLYAAGNVTSTVMGRAYPGAGATLAPAMTFGFIAAETIARDSAGVS